MPDLSVENEKRRYSTLLDSIQDEIWFADLDGLVTLVNRAVVDEFGPGILEAADVEKVAASLEIYRSDGTPRPTDKAPLFRALKGEVIANEEEIIRSPVTGELRHRQVNAAPVRVADGNIVGSIAVVRDITGQRQAEVALRESDRQYRLLFESMIEGYCVIEVFFDGKGKAADFRYLQTNPAFLRHATRPMLGKRIKELVPDFEQFWLDQYGHVALTGEPVQLEHIVAGLGNQWFRASAFRIGGEGSRKVAVLFENITERKQAEESLLKSEARFRLLAQTAGKLLVSPDPQSTVNELCREAMRVLDCHVFFNYLADGPAGRLHLNACAGIPNEEARKIEWLDYGVAVCGCVAQSGDRMIAENIQCSTDSKTDLVRSYGVQAYCCHPLKSHQGLIGTLSFGTRTRQQFTDHEVEIMRTIADQVAVAMQRISTENSLRELNATLENRVEERTAEVNALASQLRKLASDLTLAEQRERQRIAKVLHDHIQQMLVAAKLQTAALINRQQNDDLRASAKLVTDMIDQTISSSRTLTAELSPPILYDAGFGPALQWLARNLFDNHGLTVEVEFDPSGEPKIEDVRIFLFDAVRETLFNVVKHSGVRKAHVKCYRDGDDRVHAVVSDEGRGFDPGNLQSGERSEGFGLFSIQQRLNHIGGRLDIESAPGQGTRITLIAPPSSAPDDMPLTSKPRPEPMIQIAESKNGKIRVILADDHHIIRQGLAGLLRIEPDIEIVGEAANGAQAVNMVRALHPDVVVMDVSMPVLNGVEATAEIRRDYPDTQVIGLSMHEDGELSSAIRQAGAVAYVTKGGPPEALVAAIRKVMCVNIGDRPR